MKKIFIILFILTNIAAAQPKFSEMAGSPGAFSRMGFGARGIGMGNALTSVTDGNLVSYYNPALSAFQNDNSFQSAYSFLALDRSLNFLSFTRRFDFYSDKDSIAENRKPRSTAGLSIGVINSGVSNIDGRDNQGFKTKELSTSENLFFVGLANKFSDKVSVGLNIKIFYYKLYEEVTSTSVAFDIGVLYRLNNEINIALKLTDINAKYKWDTAPVYGQSGTTTEDKFPFLKTIGISYKNKESRILAAIEIENSNAGTNYLRSGIEYNIYEELYLRAGIDQFDLSNTEIPVKPSFGFSYSTQIGSIMAGIHYAFVIEPYSPADRHIAGISILF